MSVILFYETQCMYLKCLLIVIIFLSVDRLSSLQCFDAVGWVAGRASGL